MKYSLSDVICYPGGFLLTFMQVTNSQNTRAHSLPSGVFFSVDKNGDCSRVQGFCSGLWLNKVLTRLQKNFGVAQKKSPEVSACFSSMFARELLELCTRATAGEKKNTLKFGKLIPLIPLIPSHFDQNWRSGTQNVHMFMII